ncbi:MAG: hypothetical protein LBI92_06225 [Azoarcus sp.]|jgi:hypothetical protein|nr:hypothetical protein [Azoarcus sp.]
MNRENTPARWADAIAARVGTYGNGPWLLELGKWLGLAGKDWLPDSSGDERVTVPAPVRAIQIELCTLPSHGQAPPQSRLNHIVLDRVFFNGEMAAQRPHEAALPFGLDAKENTPASVEAKLGHGASVLYRGKGEKAGIVSWELDDNRVVEVRFRTQAKGIGQVQIVRLMKAVQFGV